MCRFALHWSQAASACDYPVCEHRIYVLYRRLVPSCTTMQNTMVCAIVSRVQESDAQ